MQFSNISYLQYKSRLAHWYQQVGEAAWLVYILAAIMLLVDAFITR